MTGFLKHALPNFFLNEIPLSLLPKVLGLERHEKMRYTPNWRGSPVGSSAFSPTCHHPCKKEPLIFKVVENRTHEGISSCL